MEKKLQNPGVVFALALLCCALWGSAFPCVKIGYEWLAIEGAGSQILFAGYRFFLAGIFTFLIGSFLEKRWLMIRRSSVLPVFGQGMLQTFIQYICFYIGLAHTTGAKGSVINGALRRGRIRGRRSGSSHHRSAAGSVSPRSSSS